MRKILLMLVFVSGCVGNVTDGDVGRKGGYVSTYGRGVNPRCCGASIDVDAATATQITAPKYVHPEVETTDAGAVSTTTCSTCHTTGAGG